MDSKGGSLKSTSVNGVKVYSITGNRSLATWLPPKKLQALRKDKEYLRRVELIQDLGFETATTKIKATPDGEYLIASGIYPPQVKVYELRELSMKFERHLTSEIVNFQILGDDYSKLAFLCVDRSVCLHAKYGSHYSLRIPRMGRDVAYDRTSCDLLCAASSPDLYRISLEQGRFLSPLASQSPAINVVRQSKVHGLVACGGEDGYVECFDLRAKSAIGRIDAVSAAGDANEVVTALQFDESGGYHLAVGSSAGKVFIYDLRQAHPIRVKDHMYGSPIIDIKWHQTINAARPKIVTTDKKIVRIWDPDSGDTMAGIEPTAGNINDICIFGESGLMLLALDGTQIPSYFIPALGPAPAWCVNLEILTEEMEESAETTIYDHFKFLTYGDIQRLKLQNLIGTNLLRAYMHGFFMNYHVYQKALTLADPFAYDTYRKQRIQEKLEKSRVARIAIKRKLPKVNKELAARLIENAEARNDEAPEGASKKSNKKKGMGDELLKDERFSALFSNQDFEVDEHSREYLALHPAISKKQPSLIEEHFEPVSDDEEDQSMSGNSSEDQADEIEDDTSRRTPRLLAVKDARHADAFRSNTSLASEEALALGERAAILEKEQATKETTCMRKGHGGSREMSFTVRNRKHGEGETEGDRQGMKRKPWEEDIEGEDRRGMRSLGFNPDRQSFRGRGRGRGGRSHCGGRGRGRGRSNGRGRGRR